MAIRTGLGLKAKLKWNFLFQKSLILSFFSFYVACASAGLSQKSSVQTSSRGSETFYENASGVPVLELLNAAKISIDIETYQVDDPTVQQALKNAMARGVRVRVVQEDKPVGAACKLFEPASSADQPSCANQKAMLGLIRSSKGGAYVAFNDGQLCGIRGKHCFEHGKMILVDSKWALISTGNFNTSNLCLAAEHPAHCNRDYSIVSVDNGVVKKLQTIFENDLKGSAYALESVIGSGNQKITVSPLSMAPLVNFINSAKKTIQIQNQYLNDPTLNEAILQAAKRGVAVYVMVSSACSFGRPTPSVIKKWTGVYEAFDQAGVHSKIFTRGIRISGVQGYLHAKAILVDSARAWVGSVNGSTLSLTSNREFGMFLEEPSEVQKLASFMYRDFVDPKAETWQDSLGCKHDPFPTQGNQSAEAEESEGESIF